MLAFGMSSLTPKTVDQNFDRSRSPGVKSERPYRSRRNRQKSFQMPTRSEAVL